MSAFEIDLFPSRTLRVLPVASDCAGARAWSDSPSQPWLDVSMSGDYSADSTLEAWSHVELHRADGSALELQPGGAFHIDAMGGADGPGLRVTLQHVTFADYGEEEHTFQVEGAVTATQFCPAP